MTSSATTISRTGADDSRVPRRRIWAYAFPAVLALLMSLAWAWRPSLWRDETASVSAATRPWGELPHLLSNVDAVHGVYYATLHPVASLSLANWWLRLPSALAVAVTAALVVTLGNQLSDGRTGVAAAVLWALLPLSSRYGQEARSTALGVMFSLAATTVLLEALRRRRVSWWIAYAALLTVSGYVFLFSLLAITGHAVVVLAARAAGHRSVRRFLGSVMATALLVLPLLLVSRTELAGQLSWATTRPTLDDVGSLASYLWFSSPRLALVMWLLVAVGVVTAVVSPRQRRGPLVAVGLGLSLLPPSLLLLLLSLARPLFANRYVAGGAVYPCLLAGFGVTRARGRWAIAMPTIAAVVIAALAAPQWRQDRTLTGHSESPQAVADVLRSDSRPGDGLVFRPILLRTDATAWPRSFAGLTDLGLGTSPQTSGTLTGTDVDIPMFVQRLTRVQRVWVIRLTGTRPLTADAIGERSALDAAGFRTARSWLEGQTALDLMTRSGRRTP